MTKTSGSQSCRPIIWTGGESREYCRRKRIHGPSPVEGAPLDAGVSEVIVTFPRVKTDGGAGTSRPAAVPGMTPGARFAGEFDRWSQ